VHSSTLTKCLLYSKYNVLSVCCQQGLLFSLGAIDNLLSSTVHLSSSYITSKLGYAIILFSLVHMMINVISTDI